MAFAWCSSQPTVRSSSRAEHLGAFVNEPLANRCFATLESLDQAVGDRCIALTQQPGIIRHSALFYWWPRHRART
jgi:hypothetical protein